MMEAQAPTGGRASTQLHTCSHMQPGSLWRRNGAITGSSSSGRSHHVHCIPPQRKSAPSVLPSAQHTTSRLVASAARDETVAGAASSAVEQSTDASLDLRQQEAEFRQGLVSTIDFDEDLVGACDLGMPDFLCTAAPTPPPVMTSVKEAFTRGRWLLGLLILQSTSSMVLDKYEGLLKEHLFVTLFLTMLVGAGGNAGNQSAIKVIRGLATGALEPTFPCMIRSVKQQGVVAVLLGTGLSVGGFVRVWLSTHDMASATAITASLLMIVVVSILVGTILPYAMAKVKLDPAHAGTTIQVVMDVSGVAITCATCSFVLDQLAAALATG
mmetsp:Transcript_5742/g.16437  ORF Transcript_5742/g.16437 Transcript_5742/m.16437 type:complete len:326 (-) Transcript_5742:998-1975(-)